MYESVDYPQKKIIRSLHGKRYDYIIHNFQFRVNFGNDSKTGNH